MGGSYCISEPCTEKDSRRGFRPNIEPPALRQSVGFRTYRKVVWRFSDRHMSYLLCLSHSHHSITAIFCDLEKLPACGSPPITGSFPIVHLSTEPIKEEKIPVL